MYESINIRVIDNISINNRRVSSLIEDYYRHTAEEVKSALLLMSSQFRPRYPSIGFLNQIWDFRNSIIRYSTNLERDLIGAYFDVTSYIRDNISMCESTMKIFITKTFFDNVKIIIDKHTSYSVIYTSLTIELNVSSDHSFESVNTVGNNDISSMTIIGLVDAKESLLRFPSVTHVKLKQSDISLCSTNVSILSVNDSSKYNGHRLPNLVKYSVSSNSIPNLTIVDYPILQILKISDCQIGLFTKVLGDNLTVLEIVDCKILDFESECFLNIPSLLRLSIINCNLHQIPPNLFSGLGSLEILSLNDNKLTDVTFLNGLFNLSKLSLARNLLNKVTFPSLPNLSIIDLTGNNGIQDLALLATTFVIIN